MSYSGGCEDHDFILVAADAFMESHPVQLAVAVAHDAHGDRCRAYLTETYGFDLTPVKTLYQEAYQEDAGTIVLRLQGGARGCSRPYLYIWLVGLLRDREIAHLTPQGRAVVPAYSLEPLAKLQFDVESEAHGL